MTIFNIKEDSSNMHQLQKAIQDIIDTIKINQIYISIGGKINRQVNNNSVYHLIPSYLQYVSDNDINDKESLIIIIDNFTTYDFNHCSDYVSNQENHNHHVLLYNQFVNTVFIDKFIPYIIRLSRFLSIEPNKLLICNYVKFKNPPNENEVDSLHNIPTSIYNILKNREFTYYIDCFYEWFGYRNGLCDYIYNYRQYQLYHGAYAPLNLLIDTLKKIKYDDTYKLEIFDMKIINFWNYIYDITHYNNSLMSAYDNLIKNRKVIRKIGN